MQTLLRPQYLPRVSLIPSILTGSSLIPLRKLHSESRLQKQLKKKTGRPLQKRRVDKAFLSGRNSTLAPEPFATKVLVVEITKKSLPTFSMTVIPR